MLTDTQQQALAVALRAEQDPAVVAAMAIRNDVALTEWCNAAGTMDAWNEAMSGKDLFEATDVTLFDNLTAGKRDAWRLMLSFAPLDLSRNKNRKAVLDTWGATNATAVLQACTRKATHAEAYLGGTDATTNGVTAKKLSFTGLLSLTEVSIALNRF